MTLKKINTGWVAVLLAGILALLPHTVLAQQGGPSEDHGYFGGGIARVDVDEATFNIKAKLPGAYLRAGWQFNDYMSLEARAGAGLGGDKIDGYDIKLEHFFGAYARAGLWVNDAFYPYLIGGYTRSEIKIETEAAASDSDLSWGLGVDIATSEQWRINLEYMRYYDKDRTRLNAFALGLVRTF